MPGLFTSHAYLDALEQHGCVGADTGWTPAHLQLPEGRVPSYLKSHSWGEFVFDFEIARAYSHYGLAYYPKRVCCVPFTPVPGPRLLAGSEAARMALADALVEQVRSEGSSGAHILYLPEPDAAMLEGQSWLRREQLRFVWRNRCYADFAAFLDALTSKRRKNIRRERQRVAEAGFEMTWHVAAELNATQWTAIYRFYASTYHMRGQTPYLTLGCLQAWSRTLGDQMLVCLAQRAGQPVAMAFFFREDDALYGRHWGAASDVDLLHFELCYYQGIDYAIRHGLQVFDAGVQGEHKLMRGFDPERAYSSHWFAHRGLHDAVSRYFRDERAALDERLAVLASHSAYRNATDSA